MKKKEARRLFKQKRKALTANIIETYQDSIYAQVFQLDFSRFQNIHIFLPIARQKEIKEILKHLHLLYISCTCIGSTMYTREKAYRRKTL